MLSLTQLATDYLTIRRSLGASLDKNERYITSYIDYAAEHGLATITTDSTTAWANQPGGDPGYLAARYNAVEIFSRWAHCLDARHDSLPPQSHPRGKQRLIPYLYTDDEVRALMDLTNTLHIRVRKATLNTLIGLLAVTGLRVGEAIALDRTDVAPGLLTITEAKFGKSRLVPLHPSVDAALTGYATVRDATFAHPESDAFFLSSVGTRLEYKNVHYTFHRLVGRAGITPLSKHCRPRIHDLRHTFAHNTVRDAYLTGRDPAEIIPILATYLGHLSPASTYWYLTATPDLLAAAATRLTPLPTRELS